MVANGAKRFSKDISRYLLGEFGIKRLHSQNTHTRLRGLALL
jgi:hypothetical protein